jgi:putative FmdB family regulatory protein
MPIYEYECQDCRNKFDKLQKISDAPIKICEICAGQTVRLISKVGFRLQGSGWYETDFKSDQDKKKDLAESAPTIAAETKIDAKPVAKTEIKTAPKAEIKTETKIAEPKAAATN